MRLSRPRAGFSLLDPLAAITLLGIAGTAFVALLAQTRATMASVHGVELRTREAAALLASVAREPRSTLAEKVGRRRVGAHELRVSLWSASLFSVEVADPSTGMVTVGTFVYRPAEVADAQ